jgi:hypothetical protein
MPRNSAGSMTWPQAAARPVISGTVASSVAQNAIEDDIRNELEASLNRDGKGSMRAPLRVPDGTNAAPTVAFISDNDSGMFLDATNVPAMAAGGGKRQEWTTTGSKITGTFEATGNTTVGGTLDVNGATLNLGAATVTDDGSGNLGFGAKKLTGVANPAAAQDAATKNYTDAIVTVTTDGTMSWHANFTANLATLKRLGGAGGMAILRADITATLTVASGTLSTIGTLPAGFRPPGGGPMAVGVFVGRDVTSTGYCYADTGGLIVTSTGVTNAKSYVLYLAFFT